MNKEWHQKLAKDEVVRPDDISTSSEQLSEMSLKEGDKRSRSMASSGNPRPRKLTDVKEEAVQKNIRDQETEVDQLHWDTLCAVGTRYSYHVKRRSL